MRIFALDHIVLTVADVDRSLAFYSDVLGLPAERVDLWRAGTVGFPSVRISEATIIDLLHGVPAGQNLNHFCLVGDGPIDAIKSALESKGVAIHAGPVKRSGARGDGMSVYVNDPDGNEVEVRCY